MRTAVNILSVRPYSHIQFGGVDWHFYTLRGLVRARASQEGTALVPLDIVALVIDGEVSLRRYGEIQWRYEKFLGRYEKL